MTSRTMKFPMLMLVGLEASLVFNFGIVVNTYVIPDVVDTGDNWFPGASAQETVRE
jgi:hypothetical protein